MAERLPAIISELSVNKSDGDRKKTKDRLEDRFKACDVKLDKLLRGKNECINKIVHLSSKSISTVADAKQKCQNLKERLITCKDNLRCKQDELRRLWLESLQHKYAHEMLKDIEALRKIPEKVQHNILDGKFLHATEVLVFSVKLLDTDFGEVEALKELKKELIDLESKLYSALLEELRNELFVFNAEHYFNLLTSYNTLDLTYEEVMKILLSSSKNCSILECQYETHAENSRVIVLSDCISILDKLPEAVLFLKENCREELISISYKASALMHDSLTKSIETKIFDLPTWKQQLFLLDLLKAVLNIYRQISLKHNDFLCILQKVYEVKGLGNLNYDVTEFYSKVQSAVEHFIGFYLDSPPLTMFPRQDPSYFTNSGNMSEIADFFLPRAQTEIKQSSLFKFRSSYYAIESKKYSLEGNSGQLDELNRRSSKPELLCKPDLRNVMFIFSPLKHYTAEIENAVGAEHGFHCPLHTYLLDTVNIYLDQINSEVNRTLESAAANLEAFNISFVYTGLEEKQILTSVLILSNKLTELMNLMSCFPNYYRHFLHLIYYIILDYKDIFHKVFKSMFEEEQNFLSISWAKDRDIRRLLKSYSNWAYLVKAGYRDTIEAPEEIRLRNKEESALLMRNLLSEDRSSWEIIKDFRKLSNIALLEHSLEWFSDQFKSFTERLNETSSDTSSAVSGDSGDRASQNVISGFEKLLKEYQDFSDMCLVTLHLEVRAHSFFHLLPFSEQYSLEGYFMKEMHKAVKNLTSDLLQVDEILYPIMHLKKMRYIFEGLGELISAILMHNISNLHVVNDNILQQLGRNIFIIQCCVNNITLTREVSLERTREYIDLFYLSFDEILNGIMEDGPRFNESEYRSVFRILSSKSESSNSQLERYELKLKRIFQRIPVSGQM